MCDPLSAAGAVLSLAGTMVDSRAQQANQRRAIEARNSATAAEMARQDALKSEAAGYFDRAMKPMEQNVAEQQNRATTKRSARAADAITESKTYAPPTGNAPSVVKTEFARRSNDATKKALADSGRRADLEGFGDVMLGDAINRGRTRSSLGVTSDFAGRSASLLPMEIAAAERNAYKAPSGIGSLLRIGGMGAGLAGALGAGPSFGDLLGGGPPMQSLEGGFYNAKTGMYGRV